MHILALLTARTGALTTPYAFLGNNTTASYDYLGMYGNPVSGPSGPVGPGSPIYPIETGPSVPFPESDDCVCPQGCNIGTRPVDGFDPATVIDNVCTVDNFSMLPGIGPILQPLVNIMAGVFLPACKDHDLCYATCNSPQSTCDDQFLIDLDDLCVAGYDANSAGLASCQNWANAFYSFVVAFGDTIFAEDQQYSVLQDAACEDCCCPQ